MPDEQMTQILDVLKEAFMGYGFISLAMLDDMGTGPKFRIQVYNARETTASGVNSLWESMREGRMVLNQSELHAIIIACPGHYIQQESLMKNSCVVQSIDWAPDGVGTTDAIFANGLHRHHAVKEHLCGSDLKIMHDISDCVASAKQAGTINKAQGVELEKHLYEVRLKIREKSLWITSCYDKGDRLSPFWRLPVELTFIHSTDFIDASPIRALVETHLGSNSRMFHIPDSADDILRLCLQALANAEESQHDAVIDNIRTHLTSIANKASKILGDPDLVKTLAQLYHFQYFFANKFMSTNMIFNWWTILQEVCSHVTVK